MRFKNGVIPALVALTAVGSIGLVSYKAYAATAAAVPSTLTVTGPIAISTTQGLFFGNINVSAALGTAVVDVAGTQSATGGVTATGVGAQQAIFNITGDSGRAYTLDINVGGGDMTLTDGVPANDMIVNTWTSDYGAGVITGGTINLNVGATVAVAANQPSGTYTGTFQVDVIY